MGGTHRSSPVRLEVHLAHHRVVAPLEPTQVYHALHRHIRFEGSRAWSSTCCMGTSSQSHLTHTGDTNTATEGNPPYLEYSRCFVTIWSAFKMSWREASESKLFFSETATYVKYSRILSQGAPPRLLQSSLPVCNTCRRNDVRLCVDAVG